MEERREGHIDLQKEFQHHVELSLQVQEDFQAHVVRFDSFEEDLLTVIAGPEDPLTKEREGGMREDIRVGAVATGELQQAVARLEYKERNGGVNARIKWTFWQKMMIAIVPFTTGGAFALITTWLENQG